MINILSLCSYPTEAAATRYRLTQFVEPLKKEGINLEISSFLDSDSFNSFYQNESFVKKTLKIGSRIFSRFSEIKNLQKYDLIYIQREAMFFGPAFFERLFQRIGKIPIILDLDDATYIHYVSPTYGRIGSFFKFFGKTDKLIEKAKVVTCGNRFIAQYVEEKGTKSVIIPTIVDTNIFFPIKRNNTPLVIGWIGTHSTFPLLESIFPVLEKLALKHKFVLKIIGSGKSEITIKNVEVENLDWKLEREIKDFQSLDIGLYPITTSKSASDDWIKGKSGFKAIQYLSVGIPFVMTPIGVCAEIGEANTTHFNATNEIEWYNSLEKLLDNENLRQNMGKAGRNYSIKHYTIEKQVETLATTFREVFYSK